MNKLSTPPNFRFCKAPTALARTRFQSFKPRLILICLFATACYHNVLAQTVPWSGTALTGNTHRIDNVGIGLTSPTHLLHLEKAGGVQGIFVNSLESAAYLRLSSNDDRPVEIYTPNNSPDLRFKVNNGDWMTINAGGNVGIGTISPTSRLNVSGNVAIGAAYNSTPAPSNGLIVEGNVGIGSNAPGVTKLYIRNVDNVITPTIAQFFAQNLTQGVGIGFQSIEAVGSNADQDLKITTKGTGLLYLSADGTKIGPSTGNAASWFPWTDGRVYITGQKKGSTKAGDIILRTHNDDTWLYSDIAKFYANGKVGIGTTDAQVALGTAKLYVDGNILCEEVKVEMSGTWPDFVFAKDYPLLSLEQKAEYIEKNSHLPNVPSANEVASNGVELGKMDATLLRQIEELTLHMIELKKQNDLLKKQVDALNEKISKQ
jgi:hypothetical protein